MSSILNSSYFGGNSFLCFSSSTLISDLFNRFGLSSFQINSILSRIFVEFSFKLPFSNLLSKFKNRIHFLLYYLFFELLVSQKPRILVRRERLTNLSSFKNKRELKKAKESIGVQSFTFNVSLANSEQINNFLLIIAFIIAPYTNKRLNPPSKFVPVSLVESHYDPLKLSVSMLIKNLSIFPNFNVIDDLSAIQTVLSVNVFPFKTKLNNVLGVANNRSIFYFLGSAFGLSFSELVNVLNLRFFKF